MEYDTAAIVRSVANASVGVGPINYNCTCGDPYFPNPITCFSQMIPATALFYYRSLPWQGLQSWRQELWEWYYISFNIQLLQMFHILVIASILTSARYLMNELLFKQIPVWFNFTCKENKEKFPEAAFRCLLFTVLWCWSCYIVAENGYLTDLMSTCFGWVPGATIPASTYWLHMVELGLYVHFMYATIYVEIIRKDFYVTLLHHGLTIVLLCISYGARLHGIGVLVLFIHNFGDIWLELSKVLIYFKHRNGQEYALPQTVANCTFVVFVLEWVLFRLYWFPTKLLYSSAYVRLCYYSDAPFYVPSNTMLWVLYLLHIYWSYFIALLVVRVVTGRKLADIREDEK